MAITTDMLKVIQLSSPGAVPNGLKVTALQGPNTLNSAPTCPVLAIGGFTFWPLSYLDNRNSFGMTMYDLKSQVVNQVEKTGARIRSVRQRDVLGAGRLEGDDACQRLPATDGEEVTVCRDDNTRRRRSRRPVAGRSADRAWARTPGRRIP
jgi:hypothetical protein